MRQSTFLVPTLRDIPSGADVISHQLMLRSGMIRQSAAGVYSFLPLGWKVLRKVEEIVREEMDLSGAQEMFMPSIQPSELWKDSGRWEAYGPELMRVTDRHSREFALGPTHEEVITSIVRDDVRSYKELPMTLYQIQTKFRDERRPRFGVLRGREFLMKDAYSFDLDFAGLDKSYQQMYDAYTKIFTRLNLNFRAVVADSGAMGGKDTHEFMVLSDVGEDTIAYSDESNFAANIEIAPVNVSYEKTNEEFQEMKEVETPDQRTIEEVSSFFETSPSKCIKSLLFIVDEKPVLLLVRGDHEANDIKLKHELDAESVELATSEQTQQIIGVSQGFVGPVHVPYEVQVYADPAVKSIVNGICGANTEKKHFINVNTERDFHVTAYADLRNIQEGDPSPDGKGKILFKEGIEVGHVFKLGTKYSEALGAQYLNDQGKAKPIVMGSYGVGVSRTVAAVIEEHHDDNGIVWPACVSPFDIHLIAINVKQSEQKKLAEMLYKQFQNDGYDVLYDDRPERAGVKFKDADLIGIPLRVQIGKRASENIVEVKDRKTGNVEELYIDDLSAFVKQYSRQ
ncbi:proline--tRNA ligase [Alkalicoccus halolimnae]|uniref:Proline--tRNA ligase n=1 Tax=Alkalicoccus halolimnae TaxID=1667239 RepID=A0A5C7F9L9_9BACI|nr:proline--tRNA ligase [Alkalicoccus halolimnae]TXF87342.1 proline--tRNA ligase [Alkalicoccus halolimnae]